MVMVKMGSTKRSGRKTVHHYLTEFAIQPIFFLLYHDKTHVLINSHARDYCCAQEYRNTPLSEFIPRSQACATRPIVRERTSISTAFLSEQGWGPMNRGFAAQPCSWNELFLTTYHLHRCNYRSHWWRRFFITVQPLRD